MFFCIIKWCYSNSNIRCLTPFILICIINANLFQDYGQNWRWNVGVLLQWGPIPAGGAASRSQRGWASLWHHLRRVAAWALAPVAAENSSDGHVPTPELSLYGSSPLYSPAPCVPAVITTCENGLLIRFLAVACFGQSYWPSPYTHYIKLFINGIMSQKVSISDWNLLLSNSST